MKGLLIKDYYMLVKYFKTYLLLVGVMAIVVMFSSSTPVFIIYPVIMANMLPVSLINYDELSHFDKYYQTMPISKTQYVTGKYLASLIFQLLSVFIFTVAYGISLVMGSEFEINKLFSLVSFMIFLVGVLPSILLPFVFKYGSEKGRLFYLLITAIVAGIATYFVNQDSMISPDFGGDLSFVVELVMMVVIYFASWFISIKVYSKKEIA